MTRGLNDSLYKYTVYLQIYGILFHLAKPVFHQRVCVSSKSVFQKTSLYNGKRQRYICIMSGQWYSLSLSNEWLSRSPKALSLSLVKCLSKGDLLLMVPCKNIICVFHRDSYEKRIRTLFLFSQEDSLPISLNNQCFRCILYYFFFVSWSTTYVRIYKTSLL